MLSQSEHLLPVAIFLLQSWFVQTLESLGKSWNFIVQNSRPWKVLEKGIVLENPRKSWNY